MPKLKRRQSIEQYSADDSFDDEISNSGSSGKSPPQQRNAANARERARMRVLSRAFCRLKTTLPWVPADTKLSKLDTLRLATSYIAHLRNALKEDRALDGFTEGINSTADGAVHPITLASRPLNEN
ncbi:musculin-like [Ctenocephalides felis]|uniref:musculin-like n=1 Tax=Ctenocephalides felis TaxID=7515 RepID=UPI000E6E2897|nr:musculin-like [Ctenocephalides felis]